MLGLHDVKKSQHKAGHQHRLLEPCEITPASLRYVTDNKGAQVSRKRNEHCAIIGIPGANGRLKGPMKQHQLVDKKRHVLSVLPPKARLFQKEKEHVEAIKAKSISALNGLKPSQKLPRLARL